MVIAIAAFAGGVLASQKAIAPLLGGLGISTPTANLAKKAQSLDAALKVDQTGVPSVLDTEGDGSRAGSLAITNSDSAPVLVRADQAAAPVLGQQGGDGLPAAVQAWLEHLRRIEAERQSLTRSQVSRATSLLSQFQGGTSPMLGESDGGSDKVAAANDASSEVKRTWEDLEQRFMAQTPPAECVPLQVAYDHALRETGNMVTSILGAIQSAGSDQQGALNALSQLQGQSAGRIDTPAKDADTLLEGIYRRYGVAKAFHIAADIAP